MDDQSPATKRDLKRLELAMQQGFQNMTQYMDGRFDRVNDAIDRVLSVLVHVDKRDTRQHKNHEKRIVTLEKAMVA